jgi:tRNA nucleotidyltransferase (CCA-adding enzyme)
VSHDDKSRQVLQRVLSHPALAGARPVLAENVFAVGGAVRNALLERAPGPDVDLVVDGDPMPVARAIETRLGAELTAHHEFRTAELRRADGHLVDIVGARTERYPAPGALPEVREGTIQQDLARRDFSINAIAIRLSGAAAAEIVDPEAGRADLGAGLIRILHPASFVDDPSRVVRAARYGAQLGFDLESETARLAGRAACALDPTNARTQAELVRLLEETMAPEALCRMSDLGVPWLKGRQELEPRAMATVGAAQRLGVEQQDRAGALLSAATSVSPASLELPGPLARSVGRAARGAAQAGVLGPSPRLSEVDAALDDLGGAAAVAALAAGCESVAAWWPDRGGAKMKITGADLIDAGVGSGPDIGRALAAARAASLDGDAPDRDTQLAVALRAARSGDEA